MAAGALTAALAWPLASQAASTSLSAPQTLTYQTRLVQSFHAGEYDGTMRLTVYPSGIVSGTFRNDEGGIREVTGGVDGSSIWLDIGGAFHALHLDGTLKDGVIKAVANIPGPDTYTFVATPQSASR